nr:hypothetical protein [Elizabethkingia sp. ASV34]
MTSKYLSSCIFRQLVLLSIVYIPVSYTHLTLPTTVALCRSRWSADQ